jgi:hypothetical protein
MSFPSFRGRYDLTGLTLPLLSKTTQLYRKQGKTNNFENMYTGDLID